MWVCLNCTLAVFGAAEKYCQGCWWWINPNGLSLVRWLWNKTKPSSALKINSIWQGEIMDVRNSTKLFCVYKQHGITWAQKCIASIKWTWVTITISAGFLPASGQDTEHTGQHFPDLAACGLHFHKLRNVQSYLSVIFLAETVLTETLRGLAVE